METTNADMAAKMLSINTLNELQHKLMDAMGGIQDVEDTAIHGLTFREVEPLNHFMKLAIKQIGNALNRVELLRSQRER